MFKNHMPLQGGVQNITEDEEWASQYMWLEKVKD